MISLKLNMKAAVNRSLYIMVIKIFNSGEEQYRSEQNNKNTSRGYRCRCIGYVTARGCTAFGAGNTGTETVKKGHKVALKPVKAGDEIIKYGYPIGRASRDIDAGT